MTSLALLVVGAIGGALSTQDWAGSAGRVAAAIVAAISLAMAALVQQRYLNPEMIARWPLARAASESIKAAVYRYLVGPDSKAQEIPLRQQVTAIGGKAEKLRADFELIPAQAATPPQITGIADYVELRAKQQQRWHESKAAAHLRSERRWHRTELATTVLATILAAIASVVRSQQLAAWVAAATTISASVAAHVLGTEHARVARSYLSTADDLGELIDAYERDPAVVSTTFVDEVERVLLTQNQGWVAIVTAGVRMPPGGGPPI
jgi:hypothetical protein